MPGGERTGPMGRGPMTGRMAGYCGGFDAPGLMNRVGPPDFGARGAQRGGGRGWRHCYYATGVPGWARADMAGPGYPDAGRMSPAEAEKTEAEALRKQVRHYEEALDILRRRLQKLEGEKQ
ncbi:MAG TPA: DUF5320 domain-containing protein [Candidatus Sulfotelmatobacter sp.]|nr:DUF5320 domain-containing protein [Candidatus Sulfotelmatobacter sp.]